MNIGFALTGSFCTFAKIWPVMEELAADHNVYPIFSQNAASVDSRFGDADAFIAQAESICGNGIISTIPQAEPIGPKKLFDILVIAPCTGNTLAKLAHGIADTPVTMSAKSHLRNGRPIVVAISTNDGLGAAAENIGRLLTRRHFYFVPFGQDDPKEKPTSLVADFRQIPRTVLEATLGYQIQPILL